MFRRVPLPSSAPPVDPRPAARAIADQLPALIALAQQAGLPMVAYLLSTARDDAEKVARRGGPESPIP